MLFRALLVALFCAWSSALTPLSAAADDNDCALYLAGPGRTSSYDYSLNLLRGNFGYEGQHTCITYDAVNHAYLEARKRILVSQPKGEWKPEDYASVGELILDISINVAKTYGLTYEEIEKGLPLIDTSRTLIREVCPPVFSHVECRAGKYRRLDGLCNNLQHPTWGSTNVPFQRLIGPLYADGINAPRISHTGHDLPLSRVVSRTMHPDDGFHDHAGTVMVIAWGQFMDHDYTLTATPLDPRNRNDPEECCKRPPHQKHPYCNEIRVPDDDYFYRLFGVKCIDFVRAFPSPRPGCRLGSRAPFNTLTGVIDGNTVYGVTDKFARKLRTGYGGLLRMNPVFDEYGLKDLLPLKLDIPDEGCTRPNKNMYCFEAGEIRVNEQLVLTVMHTLMAREHNRVAKGLAAVNPHWDDETLYQEARRINIAEIQHITYNEFLPILLGKDVMDKFGLVLEKKGYWDGYDPNVNPDVIASFAAAAYRFGHSLLPTAVERWSKAHKFIASKRLSDLIRRPYDLYRAGVLDEYVMGLMNQVAQAMDDSITQEVTNHLFKKIGARFGMDLVSFNMQRGREFGVPGYMEFRKFCGLPGADTFQELFGSMPNETVRKYESIFEHPIDVDLWSGGVSERPLPGSMLGPTFACIIATQFSYSRRGDRFWFELPNQPSSFTPEQLIEVRKARLARVICDNTDIIDTTQLYPFVLPDHELNPRVPCRSGIIPSMDFSKWAEPAPFHSTGAAKQFITDAVFLLSNETREIKLNQTENCTEINNIPSENINITNIYTTQEVKPCANISENKCQNFTDVKLDCEEPIESKSKAEANVHGDIILKYVYKKNKKNDFTKTLGHASNSLRRRKRNTPINNEEEPHSARIIVDYETDHSPHSSPQHLAQQSNDHFSRDSKLANFNIVTSHKNSHVDGKAQPNEDSRDSIRESQEETYTNKSPDSSRSRKDRDESSEENLNGYYDGDRHSNSHVSDGLEAPQIPLLNNDDDNKSYEMDKIKNFPKSFDSTESGEITRNPSPGSEKSIKGERYDSGDSSENEKNPQQGGPAAFVDENDEKSKYSSEESSDSSEPKSNEAIYKHEVKETTSTPSSIQDVDVNDFSYENIKPNNNGGVELVKTPNEKVYSGSEETINSKSVDFNDREKESVEVPQSEEVHEYDQKPKNLNDGETKPVIEIERESSSFESSEEDNKSSHDTYLDKKDRSQEIEDDVAPQYNEKIKVSDKNSNNAKQEFERIPLNYDHDKTEQAAQKQGEVKINDEEKSSDGTVDTFSPKVENYDENLNIKFNDLTIKMPEIKLPEDILAYAFDEPLYKTQTPSLFYHEDEDDNNDDQSHEDQGEDTRHHHTDSYSKSHDKRKEYLKNKENDDEDEENPDLYEKFVRERFGKKGSFEKRSEKLTASKPYPDDPNLYKAIQNVLKKTENTHREAAKSGDPNAGYMWTLEYGQNLQ